VGAACDMDSPHTSWGAFSPLIRSTRGEPVNSRNQVCLVLKSFSLSREDDGARRPNNSYSRQIITTVAVRGTVTARNIHHSLATVKIPACPSKNAMPKKLETADVGRKIIVKAAMAFIEELSFLVS
jgi:hypothetical protein